MDGGERLRGAGAHPRPFQQAAAARAAGDDGLELGSGGRSSGVLGFGVTRHGGRGRWALRDAGVTRNTRRQRAQAEKLGSTELTGHGGRRLLLLVGRRLQGAIEGGKREGRRRSSQRCRKDGWPAPGRAGVAESTEKLLGGRRGENVGGGVPGLFWSRDTTRRSREDRRSFLGRRRG